LSFLDIARRFGTAHDETEWDAYRDFGKGSGHPAGLNFGDCFAYALARLPANRCYSKALILKALILGKRTSCRRSHEGVVAELAWILGGRHGLAEPSRADRLAGRCAFGHDVAGRSVDV
jgi:hypothetical protein